MKKDDVYITTPCPLLKKEGNISPPNNILSAQ